MPLRGSRDSGDRRGGRTLGRAARPREEPDSTAPAPRSEEESKQNRSPRIDRRAWRGGYRGGVGFKRQVRAPGDDEKRPRRPKIVSKSPDS
ncbi:hypothetical protein NDU88_005989 [Pleurodeles waltl]|uniref:Uncharacterized protein n=1 Tax=Pleurodeles waltl TaxID=8319 RepID=A0AAV7SN96_PLEWA|nr:hypothetical protein NDU88_005989 [Pleurodeles waltl]